MDSVKNVIDRFAALIRSVIMKNVHKGDSVDVEDIEQEVLVKIWKLLSKGKKVDNLPSYIKRIAYTVTIDELRKMRKQMPSREPVELKKIYSASIFSGRGREEDSAESLLEQREDLEFITQAVDSLSENRKQVVRLYLLGMDTEEICEFFGWDKTKVRHLLYRGIDDIKEKMKSMDSRLDTRKLKGKENRAND